MRIKVFEVWVLFALAVVVIGDGVVLASQWKERMRALESGGFEILVGVGLVCLTALYWFRESQDQWERNEGGHHVAISFGILAGYALLMPHLGYLLATLVAVVAYMRVFGGYRWPVSLGFASVFAVGTAWFWAKLVIILPQGIVPWPQL